jgi:hypothetical protein
MAVKTRLTDNAAVIELRVPIRSVVASIARIGGRQVIRAFPNGDLIIVTIGARTQNFVVIHEINQRPATVNMTYLAYVARGHVVAGFTGGVHAVMASEARFPDYGAMVEL